METDKKLKLQIRFSTVTILTGIALMMFKMYADSEPGAIPILLMVTGSAWFFYALARIRHQQT